MDVQLYNYLIRHINGESGDLIKQIKKLSSEDSYNILKQRTGITHQTQADLSLLENVIGADKKEKVKDIAVSLNHFDVEKPKNEFLRNQGPKEENYMVYNVVFSYIHLLDKMKIKNNEQINNLSSFVENLPYSKNKKLSQKQINHFRDVYSAMYEFIIPIPLKCTRPYIKDNYNQINLILKNMHKIMLHWEEIKDDLSHSKIKPQRAISMLSYACDEHK